MSMWKTVRGLTVVFSCVAAGMWSSDVMATPYASGIQLSASGSTFILNEGGATVDIVYNGGGTVVNMGTLAKGSHSFDATLGTTWEIVCRSSAPVGWTQISDDSLVQSKYYSPRGVTVDANPMRWTFGQILVSEGLGGPVSVGGRTTTDGLYIMSADQGDVTGQGDTAYTGAIDWTSGGSNSPMKVSLNRNDPTGEDYTVYIGDWSDSHSGIWTADAANPAAPFNELLDNTGRSASGLVLENGGAGPDELHGSISCGPWVEGTPGKRNVYTVDEDVRLGNVLRYYIQGATSGYSIAPTDRTIDAPGLIVNGLVDVVRDEDGSWWIAQYRYDDSDSAPSLSHWSDGASAPSWTSGLSTIPLDRAYGSIDILDELDLIVMGTRDNQIIILDISNPGNPVLSDTIPHSGAYIRDVSFDAAGNVYAVSSSSETLRIYSPGGDWIATTGSDGSFALVSVPEPSTLTLLLLGSLALRWRRR